ncbi:MAG: transposase [Desulfovibrio sp.]|nr:transposase [Desulfovibrio sp.]
MTCSECCLRRSQSGLLECLVPGCRGLRRRGIFPCNASIVRLIGAVLMEQNDAWLLQDRYMPKEPLERLINAAKELAAV